jgi:hypothetical protein
MHVDVRFHVSLRPRVEYLVPEVCRACIASFAGCIPPVVAHAALSSLDAWPGAVPPSESARRISDPYLNEMGLEVSRLVHQYLRSLVQAWVDHSVRASSDALALHQRVRSHKGTPEECASCLLEGQKCLTGGDGPCVPRPDPLERAFDELRHEYATSYGRRRTQSVLASKALFQYRLEKLQRSLALQVKSILEPLVRREHSQMTCTS